MDVDNSSKVAWVKQRRAELLAACADQAQADEMLCDELMTMSLKGWLKWKQAQAQKRTVWPTKARALRADRMPCEAELAEWFTQQAAELPIVEMALPPIEDDKVKLNPLPSDGRSPLMLGTPFKLYNEVNNNSIAVRHEVKEWKTNRVPRMMVWPCKL